MLWSERARDPRPLGSFGLDDHHSIENRMGGIKRVASANLECEYCPLRIEAYPFAEIGLHGEWIVSAVPCQINGSYEVVQSSSMQVEHKPA